MAVINWASILDDATRDQAEAVASLAVVDGHVALMPDAHLGFGATVGSVIPTREALIPSAVGVDIGCGVVAASLDLSQEQLPDGLEQLVDAWSRDVPAGLGRWHQEEGGPWERFAAAHPLTPRVLEEKRARGRVGKQFGTLGSGNHFVELCADETGGLWVMLHSGSRGVGNQLAQRHVRTAKTQAPKELPDPELAWLAQGTTQFAEYVEDMLWAQDYAYASRQAMLDVAVRDTVGLITRDRGYWERYVRETVNNHHNYSRREVHDGRELWVTRKGAISARRGELGVIPGSMGTGSYIVTGLGNPASYESAPHGAGRAMSRGQARRTLTAEALEAAMAGRAWQVAHAQKLIDESPAAYKDLATVIADSHDLVTVVHKLETLVNYKGTS